MRYKNKCAAKSYSVLYAVVRNYESRIKKDTDCHQNLHSFMECALPLDEIRPTPSVAFRLIQLSNIRTL